MSNIEIELRKLMNLYCKRYEKLRKEENEAKEDGDMDGVEISKLLQRNCRIMIAELFHTMKKVGVLDEEEIEWGSVKTLNCK